MADTITITCPECDKAIKAPDSVVGKKIRCKGCGETFVAKLPAPTAVKPDKPKAGKKADPKKPDKPKAASDDGDAEGAYGLTNEYLGARCPACIEPMGDEDMVCLNCGFNISTRTRPERKKVKETTGGDMFWWLLPGILCTIAALLIFGMMISDLIWRATVTWEENTDKLYVNSIDCCLLWMTIFQIWLIYKCLRFAVKRLILDNKPPEVVEQWEGE